MLVFRVPQSSGFPVRFPCQLHGLLAFICDIMNVVADLAEDFAEVERELAESVRYFEYRFVWRAVC